MDDKEQEAEDSFKVEIIELDGPARRGWLTWPRLTPRQRRLSLMATAGLFLLVIVLLWSSISGVGSLLSRMLPQFGSVPGSATPSSFFAVYLRGNPGWGQFILDGKPLSPVPFPGEGEPLKLARGTHTIVWQAEPFRSKTCVFTVVDAVTAQGPCFLKGIATLNIDPGIRAMVLAFFDSLADLPEGQRFALAQQLHTLFAAYTSSTQLATGELYAVSEQLAQTNPSLCRPFESLALCYARATQPLLATLSIQIDNATAQDDPCVISGQCNSYQQDCRQLCSDPFLDYGQREISGWNVLAMIRLLWSYRTSAGQVIASDQPNSAVRGSQLYQSISLHLERTAQHSWKITPFPVYSPPDFLSNHPLCVQATGDAMALLNASFDNNGNMYVQQTALNPAQMAEGCLVVAVQPTFQFGSTPTPTPTQAAIPPASFLLRFGVLLAVNDSARKLCPDLPFANAAEMRLAQSLPLSFSAST